MDAFEVSMGYRSVWIDGYPTKEELSQLSSEDRTQLAKDHFDYALAEILRSTGEWHWELDEDWIGDRASEIAANLSDSQEGWDALYTQLRAYYEEQYHTPSSTISGRL
jgi:hypothetical protein